MKDVLRNLHYASTRRPEEGSRKKDGLEVSLEPVIEETTYRVGKSLLKNILVGVKRLPVDLNHIVKMGAGCQTSASY